MAIDEHQHRLARAMAARYAGSHTFSERVLDAFFHTPRHRFVSRYRLSGVDEWHEVTDDTLDHHLGALYGDHPLVLHGSEGDFDRIDRGANVSTISQPSLVLWLLDHLDLAPGQRVYELGTGSGWNAALLGRLVGERGRVVSAEIIDEVAATARRHIEAFGATNVEVRAIDGGAAPPDGAPFDRVIFTAAAHDLPASFHARVAIGGRLLLVLQTPSKTDVLLVLDKHEGYFQARKALFCGFVPVTGRQRPPARGEGIASLLDRIGAGPDPSARRPFFWGAGTAAHFVWSTAGLRSFLALHPDRYVALTGPDADDGFGWIDEGARSLAVARPGALVAYGGNAAADDLIAQLRRWVDVGMPALPSLDLRVYPSAAAPTTGDGAGPRWIWDRGGSTFVWSIPTAEG